MNILWIVNINLPCVSKEFNLPITHTGGWISGMSEPFINKNIQLCIVSFSDNISNKKILKKNNITYIVLKRENTEIDEMLSIQKIYEEFSPDIVHIHGTENRHCLSALKANKSNNVVISIQGLTSVYAKHFFSDIPIYYSLIYKIKSSIFKLLKIETNLIFDQYLYFLESSKREIEMLSSSKYVIGRTTWDRDNTSKINSSLVYFKCNETLRNEFYNEEKWDISNMEPYTIFSTQGHYPIKGFHILLKALRIVKRKYPYFKLYTSGHNTCINLKNTMNDRILRIVTEYDSYIATLIKKYKLSNNIFYLGSMSEQDIKLRLLKSNVFVLQSSIENSPNSLCEAMKVGVPIITTDVGGIKDIISDEEGTLIDFGDVKALAQSIINTFDHPELSIAKSKKALLHSQVTHDKETNFNNLIKIYEEIIEREKHE